MAHLLKRGGDTDECLDKDMRTLCKIKASWGRGFSLNFCARPIGPELPAPNTDLCRTAFET